MKRIEGTNQYDVEVGSNAVQIPGTNQWAAKTSDDGGAPAGWVLIAGTGDALGHGSEDHTTLILMTENPPSGRFVLWSEIDPAIKEVAFACDDPTIAWTESNPNVRPAEEYWDEAWVYTGVGNLLAGGPRTLSFTATAHTDTGPAWTLSCTWTVDPPPAGPSVTMHDLDPDICNKFGTAATVTLTCICTGPVLFPARIKIASTPPKDFDGSDWGICEPGTYPDHPEWDGKQQVVAYFYEFTTSVPVGTHAVTVVSDWEAIEGDPVESNALDWTVTTP